MSRRTELSTGSVISIYETTVKHDMGKFMDGFTTLEESVIIIIVLVYLLYYLLARSEMKGRPRLKRVIWLVAIPSCFPIAFLVCWVLLNHSFSAVLPALVISALVFIPLVVLSEAVSESSDDSTADKRKLDDSWADNFGNPK